jgi:hypothetical protein
MFEGKYLWKLMSLVPLDRGANPTLFPIWTSGDELGLRLTLIGGDTPKDVYLKWVNSGAPWFRDYRLVKFIA